MENDKMICSILNTNIKIDKPNAAKGLSYILKTSDITSLFEQLGVKSDINITYYGRKPLIDGRIFECHFIFYRSMPACYYIHISAVKSEERKIKHELLYEILKKEFLLWLKYISNLSKNNPDLTIGIQHDKMFFWVLVDDGILSYKCEPAL